MAKRVSTRKIKKHRLYSYDEAGDALGVAPHTVRAWRANGLEVMAATKPHYILGAELIRYIAEKQVERSFTMALDQMYCLRCKAPRKPLWGMVDYIPNSDTKGRLTGLCDACEGGLQRFVGKGDLVKLGQIYEIASKDVS
ncbi:hypothetical protein [Tateyamaria sp.]|uniref:hypothetical protein n=1 Tax=Tateyamaria sp. TaxID=1929288 RepID=UPI00329DD96B